MVYYYVNTKLSNVYLQQMLAHLKSSDFIFEITLLKVCIFTVLHRKETSEVEVRTSSSLLLLSCVSLPEELSDNFLLFGDGEFCSFGMASDNFLFSRVCERLESVVRCLDIKL
mmetsp:Transcript_12160/g.15164  ORF Transcript_12160/g.15164 Transcript_12160/m.15164 type:complete len:113 (-) Transcript_12160:1230-1568(-)